MTLADHVVDQARQWHATGRVVVIATIAQIRGSSSQPLGSRMAITEDGGHVGYVSGGCVENDVAERAGQVASDGLPRRLHYRKVTDSVFEIGLNCEGQIDVILERLSDELLAGLTEREHRISITRYRDREDDTVVVEHLLNAAGDSGIDSAGDTVVAAIARTQETGEPRNAIDRDGWVYLIEPPAIRPTLLIVSASSVAYPLCRLGADLGYRVVVSDPRSAYLVAERFPDADMLLPVWPRDIPKHVTFSRDCAVVSLNHEPRFEDDLFRMLVGQPAVGYIGAIGKRRRHEERLERQADAGYDLSRLPPVHTPVGLDLGGRRPEDVALAILAEVQAVRHGRTGAKLLARYEQASAGAQ